MPYHHRTEFPEQYAQPNDHRDYVMPDGSGPWTVVAVAVQDRPGARPGLRGTHATREVVDADLNRVWTNHSQDRAEASAQVANEALTLRDDPDAFINDDHYERFLATHEGVDRYEVALRDGAEEVNA